METTERTITDVLGTALPVTRYYGDGSYDCPHCSYPVRADQEFDLAKHNPWCLAHPLMPVESAKKILADREARRIEEVRRKRDHELAMQRIEDWNKARAEERTRMFEESQKEGYCWTCMYKSNGRKKIRHRGACPHKH